VAVSGTASPLLLAPPPPFAGVVCPKGCTEKCNRERETTRHRRGNDRVLDRERERDTERVFSRFGRGAAIVGVGTVDQHASAIICPVVRGCGCVCANLCVCVSVCLCCVQSGGSWDVGVGRKSRVVQSRLYYGCS